MAQQEEVYCMTCNKLVHKSKGLSILKTGFHKPQIPLASNCFACHSNFPAKKIEEKEPNEDNS